MSRRSNIVTPLKVTEPRHEVKCQLCITEERIRWAFGLCALCDKFICKEHMTIIADNSYCETCKNDPNNVSSTILTVITKFEEKNNKNNKTFNRFKNFFACSF